jgi:anhydro-N-acetylmuramic acid kinase
VDAAGEDTVYIRTMPDADTPTRIAIGVMTGTSLDGVDVAVARVAGTGLGLKVELVRHESAGLGPLAGMLRRAAAQEPMTTGALAALALSFGERCAEVAAAASDGRSEPSLIAVHGQTIVHRPPVSWQLINAAPIARRFGCPVVFDRRQADLAAGGQGAPITPLADWVLFRDPGTVRAVINLGGFCNVTVLGDDRGEPLSGISAFDVCACNQVLDQAAREGLDAPLDEGGAAAARGEAQDYAVTQLLEILEPQRTAGRSLGTGDEARSWIAEHAGRLMPEDLLASAVEAVGRSIATSLFDHDVGEMVVAGGGACNRALLDTLHRHARRPMRLSDDLGVPVRAREALAMAVLGVLSADGVPITLPRVTGCSDPAPVAGSWCLPGGPE